MIVEGEKFSALTSWVERGNELVCISAPKTVDFMLNRDLDSAKKELTDRGMIWSWRN